MATTNEKKILGYMYNKRQRKQEQIIRLNREVQELDRTIEHYRKLVYK